MFYKVVFYHPEQGLKELLESLSSLGFGKIGPYDSWSVVIPVTESYRPLKGSHPAKGKVGELTHVESYSVSLQCKEDELDQLVAKIKELHPYETPPIEAWPLTYPK